MFLIIRVNNNDVPKFSSLDYFRNRSRIERFCCWHCDSFFRRIVIDSKFVTVLIKPIARNILTDITEY